MKTFLTFFLILLSVGSNAQNGSKSTSPYWYFDVPIQLDFYRTNSDQLNFSRRGVIFNPLLGTVIMGNDSSKFEAHLGLGIFISKFNQQVASQTFEYEAIGLIQTSFTGYYNFSNKFQAGIGICFGWYGINERGPSFDLDGEYVDRLGDGFSSINVGNSVDLRYNLSSKISFGTKFTYWYLPQLEYTRISDYGDFLEPQKDLLMTRLEFSFRVFLRGREYNRI